MSNHKVACLCQKFRQVSHELSALRQQMPQRWKKKKCMQNWPNANKKHILEKDRRALTENGKKPRWDTISFHELRHTFAQRYLINHEYMKTKDAHKNLSQTLSHERISVTRIYTSEK